MDAGDDGRILIDSDTEVHRHYDGSAFVEPTVNSLVINTSITFPAFGNIGTIVMAASTAHSVSTEYLPNTTVAGNTLVVSNGVSNASFGAGVSSYGGNDTHLLTAQEQSLSLTGTWRLLSRVERGSSAIARPIGLFQRVS